MTASFNIEDLLETPNAHRVNKKQRRAERRAAMNKKKPRSSSKLPHMLVAQQESSPREMYLKDIQPLTKAQETTFSCYDAGHHLMLHGYAGTGKTFLALYLALDEVLNTNSERNKIYIVRSVVPSREIGFLPGTDKDKAAVYEAPYIHHFKSLFGRGDAYDKLKKSGVVEFITTSFLRGITLESCVVVVDEYQNMDYGELDTIITRAGEDCRFVFAGDYRQTDFEKKHEQDGIHKFMRIINTLREFRNIEFREEDVVRSGLVRSYILARERMNDVSKTGNLD